MLNAPASIVQIQLEDQVAIVREGAIIQSFSREDKPDLFPVVQRPTPFCILNEPGEKFTLRGKDISGLQDTLFCRVKGTVALLCLLSSCFCS